MGELIKPQINIQEFNKSQFIKEGPTTIVGVVGESKKGPSNEITFVTNYNDFTTTFGADGSYLDYFSRFFFKYGGNKLKVVRVTDEYRFAATSIPSYSLWGIDEELTANETDIDLYLQSGIDSSHLPEGGIFYLTFGNNAEYIQFNGMAKTSASAITLTGVKRGINSSTSFSYPVNACTTTTSTNIVTDADNTLSNGNIIRFTGTGGGVTAKTDYYVINRHATNGTFQISTSLGGTAETLTDGSNAYYLKNDNKCYFIAPCTRITADTVSNVAKTITYNDNNVQYGYMPATGGNMLLTDGTIATYTSIDKTTPTASVIQFAAGTDLSGVASTDKITFYLANNYGGFSDSIFAKYQEYDGWNQASYDENNVMTDPAGVDDPSEDYDFINIYAKYCGEWGNTDFKVSMYTKSRWNSLPRPYYYNKVDNYPKTDDELLFIIEDSTTGEIKETYLTSLNTTKVDYWGKTLYITDVINESSKYIRVLINPDYINQTTVLPYSIERLNLAGGTNGDGAPISEYKIIAGYNLFANKNEVDVNMLAAGGNQSLAIQENIISICEGRKDCSYNLNIPQGFDTSDAIRFKQQLTASNYGSIYYNFFKYADPTTNSKIFLPPDIQVTSLFIENNLTRNPWNAAAFYTYGKLKEVVELEHPVSDGDFDLLYLNGINPIINDGSGPVLMGIKTMTTEDTAFSIRPIRELFLVIERNIKQSLKVFLGEPNTFETRLRIKNIIDSYLDTVIALDGIASKKVVCDTSNNNDTTAAQGKIIVDIYVQPVFPTQYITLNFTVTKDNVDSIVS